MHLRRHLQKLYGIFAGAAIGVVSFPLVTGDVVVGYSVSAGDWYSGCLCKSHAVQGVSAGSSARNIPRGTVLLRGFVADQNAVSGRQISGVLIVAEGILILKKNPKAAIPALVGTFQERQCKGVVVGESF